MPIYEYQCKKCGHIFEKFQSVNDPPITTCPICHGEAKRIISSPAGFIFKGSGFYATDYKKKDVKRKEKSKKGGNKTTSGP
jgi:putative FmdB family regulatory protein